MSIIDPLTANSDLSLTIETLSYPSFKSKDNNSSIFNFELLEIFI